MDPAARRHVHVTIGGSSFDPDDGVQAEMNGVDLRSVAADQGVRHLAHVNRMKGSRLARQLNP